MSEETLFRICDIATEPLALNLSGLGEPTLHLKLVPYVRALRQAGFRVQMNTNGKKLDQKMYDKLVKAGLNNVVITSDYFPWEKGKLEVSPKCPVQLFTITREPDHPELGQVRKPLDDWAGQVGRVQRDDVQCTFYHRNFFQICWDGTIQRCCCDFNANYPFGNIHSNTDVERARMMFNHKIPLCGSCHGYIFEDGIVAGDYTGTGEKLPDAFVQLELP